MIKKTGSLKALLASAAVALLASTAMASADGVLNIYNWGDYTSPEMIKKFEAKYNVKVTITDYDSNDTALAKVKAGGHGFGMQKRDNAPGTSDWPNRALDWLRGRGL